MQFTTAVAAFVLTLLHEGWAAQPAKPDAHAAFLQAANSSVSDELHLGSDFRPARAEQSVWFEIDDQMMSLLSEGSSRLGMSKNTAMSWMLMGSIAFMMALFYVLNWHDPLIRQGMWKVMNMTVSIFSSVLLYTMLKGFFVEGILSPRLAHHEAELGESMLLIGMFFVLFVLLQVALYFCQHEDLRMRLIACATIFAHVTGFASMFGFAALQYCEPFRESGVLVVLVAVLAFVLTIVMSLISEQVREYVAEADDGVIDENEAFWIEMVEDAENDIISLAIGFLNMQIIRYAITGEMQSWEPADPPEGITEGQTYLLLLSATVSGLLTIFMTQIVSSFEHKEHVNATLVRYLKVIQNIFSMTGAWCLLFWGDWQTYVFGYVDKDSRMGGIIVLALFMTALSFFLILALVFVVTKTKLVSKRALRSLVLGMGVVVGFSWEKAFDVAIETIVASSEKRGLSDHTAIIVCSIPLFLIVTPAWKAYILPEAIDHEEEHHGDETYSPGHSADKGGNGSKTLVQRIWE